ncbi:hypothetical protein B0I35DRAFT_439446 [Stachybotrys elegans]|uniref:Uncharacterized protein n=1 Tax=Stachybotrys elegans TaxID=80388 RepID=A0A8K0SNH8_9HYPO|nr:hypothetical protein B0I35DRAFT_439446 [Stachybotrys elegans]
MVCTSPTIQRFRSKGGDAQQRRGQSQERSHFIFVLGPRRRLHCSENKENRAS